MINRTRHGAQGKEMKITATLNAYINTDSYRSTQFSDAMREGNEAEAIDALVIMNYEFVSNDTYVKVGKAHITVEFDGDPRTEVLQRSVEALRRRRDEILAEAQRQATMIDEKINSLLAIDYQPAGNAAPVGQAGDGLQF